MARTIWCPCRVCGADHNNPRSSSICPSCGAAESAANKQAQLIAEREFEASPFGQFMSLSENDRWREVFDCLKALESAS